MFTIDLLKGRGVPMNIGPGVIAIAALIVALPIVIAVVMFGLYVSNNVAISIQEQEIIDYETKIAKLSGAAKLQKSFERESQIISNCLLETGSSIDRHVQWSSVLVTLVENMPASMVMTKLAAKQNIIKKQVPKKDNPNQMMTISVPVSSLQMSVSTSPHADSKAMVKDYRARLYSSIPASSKQQLEDIRVSQGIGIFESKKVVSYEIDCIFEPRL